MARGDDALAGRKESIIPSHRFPPVEHDRAICFKGLYLFIHDEETCHFTFQFDEDIEESQYVEHDVPAGYSIFTRGASVYFSKI
ncbi:hypothetical protein ONS95_011751 [Cadophora gregata]|uniref:uncharacterized protein n=1 Tax=Cadophora gregata TaxID=51156 RepID=UPI0026DBA4F1|nr:uncharacterized protein ONS95_011751 [Cadophora gregata]KAK0120346.1 hypothetical protein ONS95_011751 [Cadophora gregata]